MDYIGVIPIPLWETVHKIAQVNEYPCKQPENCPYIILLRSYPDQFLCLCGQFRKQQIHLYIMEVDAPGIKLQNREPIQEKDWEKARNAVQELMSRAISHTEVRSSTNNQRSINPK